MLAVGSLVGGALAVERYSFLQRSCTAQGNPVYATSRKFDSILERISLD